MTFLSKNAILIVNKLFKGAWSMKPSRSRCLRALVGIGAPLAASGGLFYLYHYGSPFVCVFYQLTGLYCPGCGAGRALSSLIHGDILAALHYNAFFLLVFPFIVYYLVKQYIHFVFQKDPLPFFRIRLSVYNSVMLLIILFWILRNIPVFPFSWLAP